jgi:hypothetical protein
LPTSSALRTFAACPAAHLPGEHIDSGRWLLTLHADNAVLTRLDFAPTEASAVLDEARAAAGGRTLALSTDREDLAAAFRALGFADPAPPLGPTCTALALEHEPPVVVGVDVRRVGTFDEFLVGLEIEDTVFGYDRRVEAEAIYDRRLARAGGQWVAYVDGRAAAYGGAVASPLGVYLAGGATLPEARGRGAYRALVHERWLYAVDAGTPALVVQAQEMSRPILERLGFERVCTIYELELAA